MIGVIFCLTNITHSSIIVFQDEIKGYDGPAKFIIFLRCVYMFTKKLASILCISCILVFFSTGCYSNEASSTSSTISTTTTTYTSNESSVNKASKTTTASTKKLTKNSTVKKSTTNYIKDTTTSIKTTLTQKTSNTISTTQDSNFITIPINKSVETFIGTLKFSTIIIEKSNNSFMVNLYIDTKDGFKIEYVKQTNGLNELNVTESCYDKYGNKFHYGGGEFHPGEAVFDKDDYYDDGVKPKIVGYKNVKFNHCFYKYKNISDISKIKLTFQYKKQIETVELDVPV